MKYYLIAGEASGDLHGANLIRGLKKADPEAEFRFWGGDRMAAAAGCGALARHYKTTSFFGLVEIVRNLRTILSQLNECKQDVRTYAPDVLILIDYPGFNFRMAKYARSIGLKTFYYIAPKVWAWKENRVKAIRKYVDRLFIIFPFEIDYFRNKGIDACYEGNPLMDAVAQYREKMPSRQEFLNACGIADDKPIVALLAGSRKTEIRYNLPFMVELSKRFPDYRFVVGGVSWLDRAIYDAILKDSGVGYIQDRTYDLLHFAEAAVVTSGTATLETALIGTPEVVCYRADELSMRIGRHLVKIPFISLVNLVMGREVVRELIQWDMTQENACNELMSILEGGGKRERMVRDFESLREIIGGSGASDRFAARMVEFLKNGDEKI